MPSVPIPGGTGGMGSGGGLGGGLGTGTGGLPGGIPGAHGDRQVSIQDGNRKFTIGEPDANGRSKLTIDDGTGKPKTYDLDFGDGKDKLPGAIPGVGTDGAELVKAGADGKAVIHDGNTTITAERVPGHPDQMKLTVDDGTPPPKTYTVDFNDDKLPGATPPPGSSSLPSSHLSSVGGSSIPSGGHSFGGGGGGGGGGLTGGSVPGHDGTSGGSGGGLDSGASTGAQSPGQTDQRVAAAAGGVPPAGHTGQGGPAGGMPMGGMGAGAGQGGGDQTRTSKWRTQGQLFDETDPAAHFSGVVGEDPGNRAGRPKK
jgi:hypothetical protein